MKLSNSRKDSPLFISYKVRQGDTFETVSRKVYGVETKAELIKKANPSIEVLVVGQVLTIPNRRIDFL